MLSRPPPLSKDMPLMLLKATQVEEKRLSIAMKFRATAGRKKALFAAHKDKRMLRSYSPTIWCFCLESNVAYFIKDEFKKEIPHQAFSQRRREEKLFLSPQIGVSLWWKDYYLRLLSLANSKSKLRKLEEPCAEMWKRPGATFSRVSANR